MNGVIFGLLTGIMVLIVNLTIKDKTAALFVVAGGSFILGCVMTAVIANDVYSKHKETSK